MTLPNGIYFDLDFEEYEKIERLSKSRIKQLMISPADFWSDSWLNPKPIKLTPEQERRRKIARLLGKAYHCARLEPEVFHERYIREISQADFADDENFIATGKDMANQLEDMGEKKTGSVAEQAERLKLAGYTGPIWQIELAAWEAERGERIAIPSEAFDQMMIDMARIELVPEIHDSLSDGFAEVSILYDCPDTGLPMKARLDYLRSDGWAEFKSFSNPNGKNLEQCILDAIRFNRYYIDVACYHEAVEAIRLGNLRIIGKATEHQDWLIGQIKEAWLSLPHKIVFQQKDGIPNVLSRELQLFELPPASQLARIGSPTDEDRERGDAATMRPTALMMKAQAEIRRAKRTFMQYSEIYQRGDPWLPPEPHRQISDLDFHPSWLESL